MQCLFMSNNYYQKSLQILNKINKTPQIKPKLLFQVCCGPCSLFPLEEFDRRLNELKKIIDDLNKRKNKSISLVVYEYNHEEYMKDLLPFENEKEGGQRCHICYKKRMVEAMEFADKNNFDYFTTSLTSSRQKSAFIINKIGEEIAKNAAKVKYFYSDFKKKAWAEIGYSIAREKGYYLQEYCGCEFSLKE